MPGIKFRCRLIGEAISKQHTDCIQFNVWWHPSTHHPIRLLRKLIQDQIEDSWPKQMITSPIKLFANGQQLLDQYSIRTYGLEDDQVIHVMLTENKQHISQSIDHQTDDQQSTCLTQDDYYCVGDHVDAFIDETGSWSPAQIVSIMRSKDQRIEYHVSFRKKSFGSDQIRCLSQIRPQPYRALTKESLEPGQSIMTYISDDHEWYVATIETVKRNKSIICLWVAIINHGLDMPIIRRKIRYKNGHFYFLESNVTILQRQNSPLDSIIQNGSPIDRFIRPDCNQCGDDDNINQCPHCGCQVCQYKSDPSKQLVCDECECSFHLWCLQQPLDKVPDDEYWYCDQCRNETEHDLFGKQQSYLQHRQQTINQSVTSSNRWGYGMACTARSIVHRNKVKSASFGAIPEVPVGSWWRFRVQASEAGVHAPLVASIHGSQTLGAYSLVFSALSSQDVDLGDTIYYTACDLARQSRNKKPNQDSFTLKREVLALARNCPVSVNEHYGASANGPDRNLWKQGLPVRVLRSGNNRIPKNRRSRFLPKIGVRYDGLYKVVCYWPEVATNGQRVWRFMLRRDDPEPAPWTDAGRYRIKKMALSLQYPQGWSGRVAQKRLWNKDVSIINKQIKSIQKQHPQIQNNYVIPQSLIELIQRDKTNEQTWRNLLNETYDSQNQLFDQVRLMFRCVCCMETVVNEMVKSKCGHFFCQTCLQQYLSMNNPSCPVCRCDHFIDAESLNVNALLTQILNQMNQF